MSSVEMRRRSIRLGASHVAVIFPQSFDAWFDGLVEPRIEDAGAGKWVDLVAEGDSGRFSVAASSGTPAGGLGVGEALAVFWERVSFLLVDDLTDAMALHAATLRQGDSFILLPGGSGAGKTRLALWYRAQGYDFGSDELVTVAAGDGGPVIAGVLPRLVVLKTAGDPAALLRPGETLAQLESDYGMLLKVETGASWPATPMERGFVVFPRFKPGATLTMTPLSAGETALRLLGTCLNVRNLPRGGLALANMLSRRCQGIALDYGETAQLDGTLDVLTRQILAAPVGAEDVTALCAAFTARAAARATVSAPPPAARVMPPVTAARFPRRLTIGMATYDDFDGVYFTIQAIRNHNPRLAGEIEFIVIDNNPGGVYSESLSNFSKQVDGCRYVPRGEWAGTAMRNAVFEEASSPIVLCVDSHVLLAPSALQELIGHFEANPESRDLVQGPLVYDNLRQTSTHMDPQWRGGMWGIWADDPRGADPAAAAFEIPMQGLGVFACRRAAWAGFNPNFRGFGGEEGYIHEKTRRRGARTLCLPSLRWIHRFGRPMGTQYVNRWEHRIRNYVIGFDELGLDTAAMEAHFAELLGAGNAARIFSEIKRELGLG